MCAAGILAAGERAVGLAEAGTNQRASCGPLTLRQAAAEAGVDFVHDRGASAERHLAETMGSGVAWLDYDGDGWWDLYAVQSGPFPPGDRRRSPDRLFRNLGNGRFVEVTSASGSGSRGYGQGVVAADMDGDGDTDLYLANYGPDRLLANLGTGRFVDLTWEAGLGLAGWSSSAALADADGDGDLDLYVARYVEYPPGQELFCGEPASDRRGFCHPSLFAGTPDRFYRNRGDGSFVEALEVATPLSPSGRGLGVVFADLDGDSAPELYVANDLHPNFLFRNGGDGRFEDFSLISGAAVNRQGVAEAGMGIALGDVDGDLAPDLAVTNFDVETNTLYRNLGDLTFEDVSATSGFGVPSFNLLAFGVALADLDLDGDLDFYVANGHLEEPQRENVSYRQPDQIFLGDGKGGFAEIRCPVLESTVARGLAVADFDNDGDPDLAVQENGGPLALLRNDLEEGAWLGVGLRGAPPNTHAVGARVMLTVSSTQQVRWVLAGDSYQSSRDKRLLFGLGENRRPDALEVVWRSGAAQRLIGPVVDRYLVVYESQ